MIPDPSITTDSTKEYQVQNMSNWSTFLFVLAVPFLMILVLGMASAFHGGAIAFLVGMAIAAGLMVYFYRYLQQKILVTVGQGIIAIRYQHSPFFVPASDIDIAPADIESYKFDNFNGARFILYLKDGRRFRVAVGSVGNKQAIEQMAEHIIALITHKQPATTAASLPPRRRATYAEGTTGLVLAMIIIALMVAMGIGIIFYPQNHKTSDTVRGIGVMCTCLAFVLHVFSLRRKARKEQG